MISTRRLRAVLVFALVSAVAWAILGTIIGNAYGYVMGHGIAVAGFGRSQLILGAFGFAAGTTWAVTVALLPRKNDQVTPAAATLAGALGGILVTIGVFLFRDPSVWLRLSSLLVPITVVGAIGATVGLLIQRTAARGQLPGPAPEQPALEP